MLLLFNCKKERKVFLKENYVVFFSQQQKRRRRFSAFFFGTIKSHLCVYYMRKNFRLISRKIMSNVMSGFSLKESNSGGEDSPTEINVTWSVYKTSLVHKYSLWVGRNLFIASEQNLYSFMRPEKNVNYYYFRWNLIDKSDCDGVVWFPFVVGHLRTFDFLSSDNDDNDNKYCFCSFRYMKDGA